MRMWKRTVYSMVACTRGSQRGADVSRWEMDGAYRRMTNGGKWRTTTVESARSRTTAVKQRITRSCSEAVRGLTLCSAADARKKASMYGWKPMDSTGRHRKVIR